MSVVCLSGHVMICHWGPFSAGSSSDLRFAQLYTSPKYAQYRPQLIEAPEVPTNGNVGAHKLSPLVSYVVSYSILILCGSRFLMAQVDGKREGLGHYI